MVWKNRLLTGFAKKSFFLLLLGAIWLSPVLVSASQVSVAQSFTLVLPGDGSSYTLTGGKFTSLTISNTYFSFSMSAGDYIDVISPDKKNRTNSLNIATDCETNQSRVRIALSPEIPSQTITVTPSGNCSSSTGGSGGILTGAVGGSGGGSVASNLPTTNILAQAKQAFTPVSSTSTPKSLKTIVLFKKDFGFGSKGKDVRLLQTLLSQDKKIYPERVVNGLYGSATKRAVQRFQKKYKINSNGKVGPATRQKLAEVFGV